MVSMATAKCASWSFFPSLRINGNDFTAPASDQEDPVQTLHEDFQELHIWGHSQGENMKPLL